MGDRFVIGADFGSDSVRAVVLDVRDGAVAGEASAEYPRWNAGMYRHPEQYVFRQHPLDYIEAFEKCVKAAVKQLGNAAAGSVKAIGIDTTGSTPCPVDREGIPLALKEPFAERESAMFYLWKDHSAAAEAWELQRIFSGFEGMDYTKYQGDYSSEWYWAKILHGVRADPVIREHAYSWLEHSDWFPSLLCGNTRPERMYRCACGAGHKALWHSRWNGLPPAECLAQADPYLAQVRETYGCPRPADVPAGIIDRGWAERLGLSGRVVIGGSSFDAHAGAVGAGIRPHVMVSNIGTSAVDMLVERPGVLQGKPLRHVCGQAEDSIIPGLVGIETGQAAFGDVYAWFRDLLLWPVKDLGEELYRGLEENLLGRLAAEAEQLQVSGSMPVALDWFNGRRYPHTDDSQTAAVSGLSLGSGAAQLYRSLVFGTICGLRRIVDELENGGLEVKEIIAVGGIPRKSGFVMQSMANILSRPIKVSGSPQTCAVGAAIYGAVGAGIYRSIPQAQECMCPGILKEWKPQRELAGAYEMYYHNYLKLANVKL